MGGRCRCRYMPSVLLRIIEISTQVLLPCGGWGRGSVFQTCTRVCPLIPFTVRISLTHSISSRGSWQLRKQLLLLALSIDCFGLCAERPPGKLSSSCFLVFFYPLTGTIFTNFPGTKKCSTVCLFSIHSPWRWGAAAAAATGLQAPSEYAFWTNGVFTCLHNLYTLSMGDAVKASISSQSGNVQAD